MPPSRKVTEIVVSTLMPISRAASGSCAVARMALPIRLLEMKVTSAITSGAVTATARMSPRVISTPPMVKTSCWEWIRSGTLCWPPPYQSRPTFWRMNENPTAVISGASLGAPRNGR